MIVSEDPVEANIPPSYLVPLQPHSSLMGDRQVLHDDQRLQAADCRVATQVSPGRALRSLTEEVEMVDVAAHFHTRNFDHFYQVK